VISNEWRLPSSNPRLNPGGFTIYDITKVNKPKLLVDGFGDTDAVPALGVPAGVAHEAHSAIAWDAGDGRA
jgi:hypothetical protein